MSRTTIFEKGYPGSYYLKVEVETQDDDFLTTFKIQSCSVIESIVSNTPYLNIKFVDGIGELISVNPVLPDAIFYVEYGKNKEQTTTSTFKFSTLIYEVNSKEVAENVFVSSDMISSKWESLFKNYHCRAWSNKLYSDVVAEFIGEIGFETDIEPTNSVQNVYQPNWTNSQLLNWIAKRAINKNGVGGYTYFFRLDDTFVFRTYDSLYQESPVKTLVYSVDANNPNTFSFLTIKNKYVPTLLKGGFGTDYCYFDYKTKKFVTGKSSVTNIPERQLSDWYYLSESHNSSSQLVYGGRDENTKDVSESQVINSANSVQRLEIFVPGDSNYHCGDIINLHIPTSKFLKPTTPINEMYSGYWMIWKVAHLFNVSENRYTTNLFLTRNGIDGKSIDGLITTKTGKLLAK